MKRAPWTAILAIILTACTVVLPGETSTTTSDTTLPDADCALAQARDLAAAAQPMLDMVGTLEDNTGALHEADSLFAESRRVCGNKWVESMAFLAKRRDLCDTLHDLYIMTPLEAEMENLFFEAWTFCSL